MKKDVDFNYEIIVDIIYLDEKPVLYAVDNTIAFQAGRFLNNMSAKETWEALRQCWIDTYLGLSDIITHYIRYYISSNSIRNSLVNWKD